MSTSGCGRGFLWGLGSNTQGSLTPGVCLCSFDDIDLPSAVKYLMASDPNLQVLGAAYIQHRCYSDAAAKKQVTVTSWLTPRHPPWGPLSSPHLSPV